MAVTYYDIGLNLFGKQFPEPEKIIREAWEAGQNQCSSEHPVCGKRFGQIYGGSGGGVNPKSQGEYGEDFWN